ncbi:PepSY domain-containing protein [Hydrogenophaga sp. PAMC20947]|uniref:PepSY domain-containing protein n=1 Tax=Hydrogenophaga sp. PAMC20947 TaxID=2565558 RepID=UPI00109DAC16|nr:PepSY domain-containing protein [Hydrogenophaga sp. PAMC20947]QCB48449.1 PepSY domain-containing protein [Hydrogenophaga sp. PAMC20947]
MSTLNTISRPAFGLLALGLWATGSAVAGPKCTDEPESKWLSAEQMTKKFTDMGYTDSVKKLHVSKGKCWEIYGTDKEGKKVEIYFHPITGEIMEKNVKE